MLKEETNKICDWCGGIIGSVEYNVFTNSKNPNDKIYFHKYCHQIMKVKGLIGVKKNA